MGVRTGRMVNEDEATWGWSEIPEMGLVQPRLGRKGQVETKVTESTNKEASVE